MLFLCLQTAEQSLSEINNIVIRLKELNIAAATTTVSDHERRYLFIEYEALRDELTRTLQLQNTMAFHFLTVIASAVPEQLVFRVTIRHLWTAVGLRLILKTT